jgi:Flp pilus assembly protein TadD
MFAVTASFNHRGTGLVALLLVASLALAGCKKNAASLEGDGLTTASIQGPAGDGLSFKKADKLAKEWQANKGDANIGFAYAGQLEMMGQKPNAVAVLKQVAEANVGKSDIQSLAGRKLMGLGAVDEAASALEGATASNPQDYKAVSALGSLYDQMGRHGEAREQYIKALAIKPDAVATRNNLAMSHALQGQLPEAEKLLRELMNTAGANAPRVRQNLALVVGLQGRFDEAKTIASQDLPPDQVEANLAYLQTMLSRPNTWKQLQDGGDKQTEG